MMIWARPTFHFFHDLTRIHKQQQQQQQQLQSKMTRTFIPCEEFIYQKIFNFQIVNEIFLRRFTSEKVMKWNIEEIQQRFYEKVVWKVDGNKHKNFYIIILPLLF